MGCSLSTGIYKSTVITWILKHLLPNNVKISIKIDNIRLKSILNKNQTSIFTKKKSFLYTILAFAESHLRV